MIFFVAIAAAAAGFLSLLIRRVRRPSRTLYRHDGITVSQIVRPKTVAFYYLLYLVNLAQVKIKRHHLSVENASKVIEYFRAKKSGSHVFMTNASILSRNVVGPKNPLTV